MKQTAPEMPSQNTRRIAKNTVMLYIRMLLTMLVSLYTSRVILSVLGVEDFGIYNVIGGVVIIFSFLNSTLTSGTQRFLTFQLGLGDFEKLRNTFSASLWIHGLLAIFVLLLAETVGLWFLNHKMNIPESRIYAANWVFQFTVFTSLLTIVQAPYNACIIAHERMNIYAYLCILEVTLKLALVFVLTVVKADKLILYAGLVFLVNLFVITIYRIYCHRSYPECRFRWVKESELYKSLLSFSGWNIFGCLGYLLSTEGVNVLLNLFFGPAVNAARGIAFQVNLALNSFVNNFQTAVNPQIVKLYATREKEKMNQLLYQNSKYAFCLLWFLSLPILLELETILHIWLKIVPDNTALFCRIIILQSLFYSLDKPFVMAIHATGKMKQTNLLAGILLVLVLPVSYFLLRAGLPDYVPLVLNAAVVPVCFCIELYYLKKWIGISFRQVFRKILWPVGLIVLASLPLPLGLLRVLPQGLPRFFAVSSAAVVSVLVAVYVMGTDPETRSLLRTQLNRFLRHG